MPKHEQLYRFSDAGGQLNKGRRFPPEPLSAGEVRQLLAVCDTARLTGLRDHALLAVMWRSGLRCSEALALRPSDVNYDRGTIRVLCGKGGKSRTAGVDNAALAVIGLWADARSVAGIGDGPLFCSIQRNPGHPMNPRYVRALVARLAVKAGISHRVHPHGLRHTHAVELAREGMPVPLISRQLGHSNVATTDIYLAGLYPSEVIERVRARSWA
jgi:site-specific recombinase XerD